MGGSAKYVLTNRTEKASLPDGDWWFNKRAWNGKIDELIHGSTYGLSPRQIMQKHKFLKQNWLQPDEIDTQVATLVTATTRKMQEITEEEMSGCDTISTNSEQNSPQQPKRDKFDVKSFHFKQYFSPSTEPIVAVTILFNSIHISFLLSIFLS